MPQVFETNIPSIYRDSNNRISNPQPIVCDVCREFAHWYMLQSYIWKQVNQNNKYLCLVCVEYRLKRQLSSEDFTMLPS